jgi:hypothetical protein
LNDSGLSQSPGKFDAAKITIGELASESTRPVSSMNDNFSGGLENGRSLASPVEEREEIGQRWRK